MSHSELMKVLESRFEENMNRHKDIKWEDVKTRLDSNKTKLDSLGKMEETGGEPDVIAYDGEADVFIFCDCSKESPKGRRNTCYDQEAEDERIKKGVHPKGNALGMAADMGIEILNEEQYFELQKLGEFDNTTSSWLKTPHEVRELGGAIFGDRRFGRVFIYHNGAPSFYSARGFRGILRV